MLEPNARVRCGIGARVPDTLVVGLKLHALVPVLSTNVAMRASPLEVTVSVASVSNPLGIKSGPVATVPNAHRVYVPTGNGGPASSDGTPASVVEAPVASSRRVRAPHASANALSATTARSGGKEGITHL
jgi:hypothetical protein